MSNKYDSFFRLFYEDIKTKENPYKQLVKFELSQFKSFYKDIFKIKTNIFKNILSDSNILIETIDEVNFHQPVLDMFLNARFGEQITAQHILNKLNSNWIFYDQFHNYCKTKTLPIYVFKFDFLNDSEIFKMFTYLNSSFRTLDKQTIVTEFKQNLGNCLGFVKVLDNAIIFGLNNPCSKQTVAHELCHYFQNILPLVQYYLLL